jgi:hypothetical protein
MLKSLRVCAAAAAMASGLISPALAQYYQPYYPPAPQRPYPPQGYPPYGGQPYGQQPYGGGYPGGGYYQPQPAYSQQCYVQGRICIMKRPEMVGVPCKCVLPDYGRARGVVVQ